LLREDFDQRGDFVRRVDTLVKQWAGRCQRKLRKLSSGDISMSGNDLTTAIVSK
jgi:hypothetical protein